MKTLQTEFKEAWLLEAIAIVSFCIVQDGAVYAPILERLERELELIAAERMPSLALAAISLCGIVNLRLRPPHHLPNLSLWGDGNVLEAAIENV